MVDALTYQVEKYSDALPEMRTLYNDHWLELGTNHDVIKLNMDYKRYEALDAAGVLHLVTVRNHGDLIGYYLSIIMPHLHYADVLTSFGDIMYLQKQYRRGFSGVRLLKFAEESMRAIGVKWIFSGSKLHFEEGRLGKVLELLGYTAREVQYTKYLGG